MGRSSIVRPGTMQDCRFQSPKPTLNIGPASHEARGVPGLPLGFKTVTCHGLKNPTRSEESF